MSEEEPKIRGIEQITVNQIGEEVFMLLFVQKDIDWNVIIARDIANVSIALFNEIGLLLKCK